MTFPISLERQRAFPEPQVVAQVGRTGAPGVIFFAGHSARSGYPIFEFTALADGLDANAIRQEPNQCDRRDIHVTWGSLFMKPSMDATPVLRRLVGGYGRRIVGWACRRSRRPYANNTRAVSAPSHTEPTASG